MASLYTSITTTAGDGGSGGVASAASPYLFPKLSPNLQNCPPRLCLPLCLPICNFRFFLLFSSQIANDLIVTFLLTKQDASLQITTVDYKTMNWLFCLYKKVFDRLLQRYEKG